MLGMGKVAGKMNITDFTTVSGVLFEANKATFEKCTDGLTVHFGSYARVVEHVTLREGDYLQGSVEVTLPPSYPLGKRLWSERIFCWHNWQEDTRNTVRLGVMMLRSGYLAIVSNRGSKLNLLAMSSAVPPLGEPFELSFQAYLSSFIGYTAAFLDGRQIAVSTLANIDKGTTLGRGCIGIDGAEGATGQMATFRTMRTEYSKRI